MSSAPPNELALSQPPPDRPELPDGVEPTGLAPRWKPSGVLVAFALGLAGTLAGALVLSLVAVLLGADADDLPPGVNIALTVVQDVSFIAAALFVASKVVRPRAWHFGLRGTRPGPFVGWVVVAFLAFLAFSLVYGPLVDVGSQEELPDELGADGGTAALIAAAFLVTVIAPVAEEFFFRGYVFGALRNWKGIWVGALLTGLIFGAIHLGSAPDVLYLPLLAFFGVVLCLLYVKTGSIYPCIVLHAINNCIAFAGTRDGWTWEVAVLFAGSLGSIALVALLVRRFAGPAPALLPAAR
ncbi:MAG: Abortive infection protein [Solirubrobacterales bacterium]|jgi:membrane protease YdiL (CAAX protease family)|nr:Abortive infection protein [Solirubrobacterales bacterium]